MKTSPFIDEHELLLEAEKSNALAIDQLQNFSRYSPFTNEYENESLQETEWGGNTSANQYFEMLSELHDGEFESAVDNLVMELQEHVANFEANSPFSSEAQTQQMANDYLKPILKEAQFLFESMANELESLPVERLNEQELESAIEGIYSQKETNFTPAQEFFLKKLVNKAKAVVKKVANVAKKASPVHMIFKKIAPLVQGLLKRVLDKALNRLPVNLRGSARLLAAKLFKKKNVDVVETTDDTDEGSDTDYGDNQDSTEDQDIGSEGEAPTTFPSQNIQAEFDHFISRAVNTDNEGEFENILAEYEGLVNAEFEFENIEVSKTEFIKELNNLKEGEDPTPALENFLPAALKAAHTILKTGIKLIGRPKVVSFLANLLAKWISKYIGEEKAKSLSMVVADKGLALLRLETTNNKNYDISPVYEAIANTVEEVANKISRLDEETINNEELLSYETYQAFEKAAAAYFPDNSIRYEARESETGDGYWQDKGGYLKHTKVFKTTLTLGQLKNVKTFGGIGLDAFIRDGLGISTDTPFSVDVHLYQAKKGTTISGIAHKEKNVPGLGNASRRTYNQLHVLTKIAAANILGQPDLGKDVRPVVNRNRDLIFEGERFYYLQFSNGIQMQPANTDDSLSLSNSNTSPVSNPVDIQPAQRSTQVRRIVTGSFKTGLIIKDIYYFSEIDSKNIAEGLKDNSLVGLYEFIKKLRPNFEKNFFGDKYQTGGIILKGILDIADKLIKENVSKTVLDKIRHHINDFENAVKDPKSGVTVVVTYQIAFENGKNLRLRVQDIINSSTIGIKAGFAQVASPNVGGVCPNCSKNNFKTTPNNIRNIGSISKNSFPISRASFN